MISGGTAVDKKAMEEGKIGGTLGGKRLIKRGTRTRGREGYFHRVQLRKTCGVEKSVRTTKRDDCFRHNPLRGNRAKGRAERDARQKGQKASRGRTKEKSTVQVNDCSIGERKIRTRSGKRKDILRGKGKNRGKKVLGREKRRKGRFE